MGTDDKIALVVSAGLLAMLLLTLSEPPEPSKPAQGPPLPPKPPKLPDVPKQSPPVRHGPEDTDDETALARMLVSETSHRNAWPVIGWMALQTAREKSLYERLTAGVGYGPRVKGTVSRYAATTKPPTEEARGIARRLLSGELEPSAAIRTLGHSSWVELLTDSEQEATDLLRKQGKPKSWGGVFGRIRGTGWYLLNPKAPAIAWRPGAARAALAKVPIIDPIDSVPPT